MKHANKGIGKRLTGAALIVALLSQISACGTLIYPERKGQSGGKLDIGVVALDAIGLLFFFVPGVIAFAVDFVTGAIYLPGGGLVQLSPAELESIKNNDGSVNENRLKSMMDKKLAAADTVSVGDLNNTDTHLHAIKVESKNQLAQLFERHPTPSLLAMQASGPDRG